MKWNGRKEYCFVEEEVKKKIEWKFQKELTFRQILKTLLIIHLYLFLFHSLYFYPTLRPNKVLIWSWRLCSSDIDMTEKKKVWYKYFWHPLMRLLVHSWLSVFHVIYMWGVWFCLHYSTHIYCWERYTPFQSDFIYWVITLERIELKHTFK